eukprot:10932656-Lingulodinium_polyedra.AAC.1
MMAPVLEEDIAAAAAGDCAWPTSPLLRARRNAAAHHFKVPARIIAVATGAALNRIQRAGR